MMRGRWTTAGGAELGASQGHMPRPRRRGGALRTLIALVGLAPLLLAACDVAGGTGAQLAKDQTFVWPYYPALPTDANKPNLMHDAILDPEAAGYLVDSTNLNMLYTNLVTFDSNQQVVPDAITRLPDIDTTATIYTFHLRPNMFFNDGTPLTAQDFAYGIDRSLDPNLCATLDAQVYTSNTCSNGGPYYLAHILGANARASGAVKSIVGTGSSNTTGINVLDPLTLQIRLDAPVAFFLNALTYPASAPMERAFVEKPAYAGGLWVDHLDQAGTSGPFKIQSYGQGKQLTLVPNTYWEKAWGKQLMLTQVQRPVTLGIDAEYADYRTSKYDYTDVPPNEYSRARGQGDFYELAGLQTDYFGLNFRLPPFDSLQVRQAFDLALNKQFLVDNVENGGALPTNHIIPKNMPGFNPNLLNPPPDRTPSITGNQAAALQLLSQAQASCGQVAPGAPPTHDYCPYITGPNPTEIDVYVNIKNATRQAIVNQAAATWNSILHVHVVGKPIGGGDLGHIGDRDPNNPAVSTNPYQAWAIGWVADYPDPQDWTTLQFQSGTLNNYGAWGGKTLDTMMLQADVEQNVNTRLTDYNKVEQAVVDSCAWIPYQQAKVFWRLRPWVHGFGLNPLELMVDINWPNVYITNHSG